MSPLALFLAAVVAACVLCAAWPGGLAYSKRSNAAVWFRRALALYGTLVAFALVWMIHHFVGWEAQGSPSVPRELQRRIQHTGYYFAPDQELRLRGRPADPAALAGDAAEDKSYETEVIGRLLAGGADEAGGAAPRQAAADEAADEGFVNPSMQAGESLTLKPLWEVGGAAARWALRYKVDGRPLRVKSVEGGEEVSRCVNVPEDRWLDRGDALLLTSEEGGKTRFISVRWGASQKYWWPLTRDYEVYLYGEGAVRADGTREYTKGPDLLMSERTLNDAIKLSDLIRRGRKEFSEQVGSIGAEWWDALGRLTLVREVRGRHDSRVGVLVGGDLFRRPGFRIYRLRGDGLSQPWAEGDGGGERAVPASASVVYGVQGLRNSFELKLSSKAVDDYTWGQVVHVKFGQPKPWMLPPSRDEDFIITSSNDYIPLDGYLLDIGDSPHSFYAKARLDAGLDSLSINDGRNAVRGAGGEVPPEAPGQAPAAAARRFGLGDDASLGDYDQGVLVALTATRAGGRLADLMRRYFGAPYVGPAASVLLVLNLAAFLLVALRQKGHRPRLLLAWAVIWGVVLSVLCVRLVLAYRVSLVPPLDAGAGELGVFDMGVDKGLAGLLLFALLTLTLSAAPARPFQPQRGGAVGRALARLWRLRHRRWFAPACVAVWGGLLAAYTVAGWLLGTNQSFGGVRISIADHVLAVAGMAFMAGPVLGHPKSWLRILAAGLLLLSLLLQIVVVKDAGAIIYSYSLLLCVGILLTWRRPARPLWERLADFVWRRRRLRRPLLLIPARARRRAGGALKWLFRLTPVTLPLLALGALALTPYLMRAGWLRGVVQPHLPETTFYRFVSFTDSEDIILTTKGGEEPADMSKLLDNSLQNWQMLLYASHGASEPVGYARAPLSKVGMTYATSVSDCAFATYLLAEHGRWAATLLLLLYCLLACACVYGAWHFDDNTRHRALPLTAVGAYFACNALYMAGANTGLSVFTGQNLPLLGLNSFGDLSQGLLLSWLAGWLLLATAQEGSPREMYRRHPVVLWTSVLLSLLLPLWFAAVVWRIGGVGADENYRKDHNFKRETLDRMERDLPPDDSSPYGGRNSPLALDGDRIEPSRSADLFEIEKQYVKQFNDRVDKFDANGGFYYLDRAGARGPRLRINRGYFSARSPFKQLSPWPGSILAGGESEPTVYKLNSRMKISLRAGGEAGTVDIDESRPALTNSSVSLRGQNNYFCELLRKGDRLEIDPHIERGWDVYVDGKRLTGLAELAPLSIVVIERRESKYRRNLIYLGATRPVLAYVRWRNGEQRRMYPEGGFPLAYMLGRAADRAFEMESKLPAAERKLGDTLALNLDLRLHQSLQQAVASYAAAHANYSPLSRRPNRLAVTVLDLFSGRVLALPSWPQLDPGRPDYEALIERVSEPARSRFEDNHNLTSDHVVGSTIKPVVLAAMASALRGAGYDVAKMKVVDRKEPYAATDDPARGQAPRHPHRRVNGISIKLWDCNGAGETSTMADFIIHSRDLPEGVLGMLGMLTDEREFARVRVPDDAAPDLLYDGRGYALDMTRASANATAFTIQDQLEGRRPGMRGREAVNQTILFRGLASLFDFVSQGEKDYRRQRACEHFLPALCNPGLPLSDNHYLDNVTAPRLSMGDGDFQDVRDGLISCLLGGGDECDFNNVMMAEAAARLATGLPVFAKLEGAAQSLPARPLPWPLGDAAWRNANIVSPMQKVGEVGTAREMRGKVEPPAQYKVIYKTGTLAEGARGRESEALMFVIGRWENGGFVEGGTLAGFLYMERSKDSDKEKPDGKMKKFEFAAPIVRALLTHLGAPTKRGRGAAR